MSPRLFVSSMGEPSEGGRLLWLAIQRAGSQSAIAASIGATPTYVGRWLRGRVKPRADFRSKLRAHGIPFDAWDSPPKKPFSLPKRAA